MSVVQANGYSVVVGKKSFSALKSILRAKRAGKLFILVDENSQAHCLPRLVAEVPELSKAEILEIESGESQKNLEICIQLWRALSDLGADRKSLLINLGGGVIGDLGGFLASCYMRGIDYVQVPTTLLSMVDASIGGKTGVDLDNLKNLIGTFSAPLGVIIYPPFLKTLSEREWLSGYAEIIKHALIADAKAWRNIVDYGVQREKIEEIILHSVNIKNTIVENDPKEKGPRKALNFGHTIGHAIETLSLEKGEHPLLHGEAIAVGMICESWISWKMTGLPKKDMETVTKTLFSVYKFFNLNKFDNHRLIELMKKDKKNEKDKILFTLLPAIGEVAVNRTVSPALIIESLNYYRELAYGL